MNSLSGQRCFCELLKILVFPGALAGQVAQVLGICTCYLGTLEVIHLLLTVAIVYLHYWNSILWFIYCEQPWIQCEVVLFWQCAHSIMRKPCFMDISLFHLSPLSSSSVSLYTVACATTMQWKLVIIGHLRLWMTCLVCTPLAAHSLMDTAKTVYITTKT